MIESKLTGVTNVTPNSQLKLLQGVPFDLGEDTILFNNSTEQFNFFNSHTKYTYDNLTPISLVKGFVKVNLPADQALECNYLMFKNPSYSDRWYYCIITKVEWVSISTCFVYFENDDIQTYMFNGWSIKNAFIEREHVVDDTRGLHTIDEGLEIGDYITYNFVYPSKFIKKYIVLCATEVPEGQIGASMYDGLYTGVGYRWDEATESGAEYITNIIRQLTDDNKSDSIIAILLLPEIFVSGKRDEFSVPVPTTLGNISGHGYTPRNKKLLTYPYINCVLSTNDGNYGTFKWELSDESDGSIKFKVEALLSPNPQAICYPTNYAKSSGTLGSIMYKLTLTGFPQCPYAIDSYKAWLAMNGASTTVGVLGTALSGSQSAVTGALAGGAVGGVVGAVGGGLMGALSGITSVGQTMAQISAIKELPAQAHGTQGGNFNFQRLTPLGNFTAYTQTIKEEYARSIDDFFDMYGYKVNRKGIPSLKNRSQYDYVKLSSCFIDGNIPQLSAQKITQRFMNGIRFWHNVSNFRNFKVENKCVGSDE